MAKRARSYRFEMPYQVDAPVLTDETVGIDRVLLRGQHDCRTATQTLLDTPDERLGWAGVLLAHQVAGDTGHWLLRAPAWEPWLPAERIEPLYEDDEVPDDIAELLRPFRRRAALGPVAGITVEQAAYGLLDADGEELGQVIDDRITARRGGLAIARNREVTFEPGPLMTAAQRTLVVQRLTEAGGARVPAFPEPADRLAGLMRPQDVPDELPEPGSISLEDFLAWLFATRLRRVIRADLRVRAGQVADTTIVLAELSELADVIRGVEPHVDVTWAREIGWRLDQLARSSAEPRPEALGDLYYDVLDALATGARAPRLRTTTPDDEGRDGSAPSARDVLRADAVVQVTRLARALDALTESSPEAEWIAAKGLADQLVCVLSAGEAVLGKMNRRARKTGRLVRSLEASLNQVAQPDDRDLASWTSQEAYEAGRTYQRGLDEVIGERARLIQAWAGSRSAFLETWPEAQERILAVGPGATDAQAGEDA